MQPITSADSLSESLRTAQAGWTGCDWDLEFGPEKKNLRGLRSGQARLAAQATRGDESVYWREVSAFLEQLERDASSASQLASDAVQLWMSGNHQEAIEHLDQAIRLEARYREPVTYSPLRKLIAQTTLLR